MRRGHPQRIEHPSQGGVGAQRDALGVRCDLLQQVKAMVALRVAVDYPRSQQERLVLELLVERRLARAERADAQDGRVAIAVGSLPQVEPHRLTRSRQRVTEVEAAARPPD